jgi:type 1 glutamine amidotransferase
VRRIAPILVVLLALGGGAGPAGAAKKRKKVTPPPPPRVLVYSGTAGFRHGSIPHGNAVLARLARITGRYTVELIDEPDELTAARLVASDIVVWNSTTGAESPFTDAQQDAYMAWVACGGGHMGVHASTDSYKDWPGWAKLTGAFFKSHPITPTSAADDSPPEHEGWGEPEARVLVKDASSSITTPWRGRDSFLLRDEFYALDRDPAATIEDFRVVLAFGGFTDPIVSLVFGSAYVPQQPLAWTGSYRGKNRISYTNLGHSAGTWDRGDFQDSLLEAITWVGGKRPDLSCLRAAGLAPPAPTPKRPKKVRA